MSYPKIRDDDVVRLDYDPINDETQTGLITVWLDGEQVGSLSFGLPSRRWERDRYAVALGQLFVIESQRRRGFGTMMLDAFFGSWDVTQVAPFDVTYEGAYFMEAYCHRRSDIGRALREKMR